MLRQEGEMCHDGMGPAEGPAREGASRYWEAHLRYDPQRQVVWRELARVIQADVPVAARLLELGAGYCYFVNNIRAAERHALDLEPRVREFAGPGVQIHVGSCTDLSMFPTASLDVVFASNVLEHLVRPDVDATLREVRRVLSPGGRLILLQPNFRYSVRDYFDDYTHVTVFTDWSLARWVEAAGFSVSKLVPRFIPGDSRGGRPKHPWLVRLYLKLPVRPFAQQMYLVAQRP